MYIDIHAHLDLLNNPDKVIERATRHKIIKIITSGLEPETNRKALALSDKYDIVNASLSLFPKTVLRAERFSGWDYNAENEIDFIREQRNKFVAIGETGLDFYWDKHNKKEQIKLFQTMLALAEELKKPVIVHCRDAEKEVFEILKSYKKKNVIIHCYTGNINLALDTNYYFSIPPSIKRLAHFQDFARALPLNKILTETDSPFQSPLKGLKNEPMFVQKTILMIADLKDLPIEKVQKAVLYNAVKIF